MGAWDVGSFDNDDAADWLLDHCESDNLNLAVETLNAVAGAKDYVESPEAACAIAACEVLASLIGKPGNVGDSSDPIQAWIAANPQAVSNELRKTSCDALDRILADDSEMNELWEETEHYESWKAGVLELRGRLA